MEFENSFLAFALFFLPGIFFAQGVFLFQRVSVEQGGGLFEKVVYAAFFAPLVHLATMGVLHLFVKFLGVFVWPPVLMVGASDPSQIMASYRTIIGAVLLSDDVIGQKISEPGLTFVTYQTASVLTALSSAWLVCLFSVNFTSGLPGARLGIYAVVNGFVKRHVAASVLCRDPSHEGQFLNYTGFVNKARIGRNGEIQYIYLTLPEKRVVRFSGVSSSDSQADLFLSGQADDPHFVSGERRIIDIDRLSTEFDQADHHVAPLERQSLLFIDGAEIVNSYFYSMIGSEENKLRFWLSRKIHQIKKRFRSSSLSKEQESGDTNAGDEGR